MLVSILTAVLYLATFLQPPAKPADATKPDSPATTSSAAHAPSIQKHLDWTIDGVKREAIVLVPAAAATTPTPIVFAFHGHGGSARQASLSFHIHTVWPDAIVVYMQGLPTPGALTDPEGKKNGWQNREGLQGDRDLKFFDAVLESLRKEYKVDDRRIYAMGHSNGGGFTYLLWTARPDVFAAFAPSGAFTPQARNLKPKPAMHIAGKNDELVKFQYQERTIEAVKKVDGCQEKGEAWAKDCTLYPSKTGTPLITLIYDGGHQYPVEAPALIVKFFKEQAKPAPPEPGAKRPD